MSIEKGVYARLAADTTLRTVILTTDSPPVAKVFAQRIEQEVAPPFIRFFRAATHRPGAISGHNGAVRALIQVDVFATTYGEMKTMMDAVRLSLDGFKGAMGTVTSKGCRILSERDYFDAESELFVGSSDFNIWYVEPTS